MSAPALFRLSVLPSTEYSLTSVLRFLLFSWQSLLDTGGTGRLRYVLVVSIHRTDDLAPPPEQLLSLGATPIKISRLDELGVATFLSQIFHWTGDDLQANYLVAFLFDQTLGSFSL